jgi:molybdopterin converting factor subunit 1
MESMEDIRVLLFGAAADLAGTRETDIPARNATLDELWVELAGRYPDLTPMHGNLAFAVNGEYARGEDPVKPGDEVAVLPPVSGG